MFNFERPLYHFFIQDQLHLFLVVVVSHGIPARGSSVFSNIIININASQ